MYKSILLKLQDVIGNLLYKHELKYPTHMTIEYCIEDDVYMNERGERINVSSLNAGNTFKFNKKEYIITDTRISADNLGMYKDGLACQLSEYNRKVKIKKRMFKC